MNKKMLQIGLIALTALTAVSLPSQAANAQKLTTVQYQLGVKSVTDYQGVHTLPAEPFDKNGVTYVPIRSLANGLQLGLTYDKTSNKVQLKQNGKTFTFTVNSSVVVSSSGERFTLPANVVITKQSTFVPIRSTAKLLGASLFWDAATRSITVTAPGISSPPASESVIKVTSDFSKGNDGWEGNFADIPATGDLSIYELEFARTLLPIDNNKTDYGLKLKSMNRSDDVFMYISKKITGLKPNTAYTVDLNFDMYTDQEGGGVGIGGAPAEAVSVKAGIVNVKPERQKAADDYYRMNIDIGSQFESGADMDNLGNIAKPDSSKPGYQAVPFTYSKQIKSNSSGELHLVIGTDSGYEGLTTLYYNHIQASFTPVS